MKRWTKIYVTLGLVAVIVVAGLVWRLIDEVKDAKLEVVSDNKIDISPEVVQSINRLANGSSCQLPTRRWWIQSERASSPTIIS